jgi:hypothetical protein
MSSGGFEVICQNCREAVPSEDLSYAGDLGLHQTGTELPNA